MHEVLLLNPLDEFLEDVRDGGEETPEKPQECPTPTQPEMKKEKKKGEDHGRNCVLRSVVQTIIYTTKYNQHASLTLVCKMLILSYH